MTQANAVFEAVDALVRRVGRPAPGRPGLVVAAPGAGKTPLLLHLAQRAAVDGEATIVLALGTSLAHLRAQHAAVVASGWATDPEVSRRMLFLAVPGSADVEAIVAQAEALKASGAFAASRLVVDGLPPTRAAVRALAEGSQRLGIPAWAALTVQGALPDDLRVLAGPVVRLEGDGATVHLRDGDGALLPWSLDATSMRVDAEAAFAPGRLRVLHGGADGAEAAFGEMATAAGHEERTLTWAGRTPSRAVDLMVLDEDALGDIDAEAAQAEEVLHRSFGDSRTLRRVLRLQACLAEAADEVVVVGEIREDGTVSGGTGWAVEVAKKRERRLWVFDQPSERWKTWRKGAWVDATPTLAGPVVCGTGTRNLTEAGRAAIAALLGADGPTAG